MEFRPVPVAPPAHALQKPRCGDQLSDRRAVGYIGGMPGKVGSAASSMSQDWALV